MEAHLALISFDWKRRVDNGFFLSVFNFRGICSAWTMEKPVTYVFQVILYSPYFVSAMLSFVNIRLWTQRHICHYLELDTVSRGDV